MSNELSRRVLSDNFLTSMNNLWDDFMNDSWLSLGDWVPSIGLSSYPRLNITEDDKNLYIEASCPGLKQEDINVEWAENVLTIRGKSINKTKTEDKDKRFLRRELHQSSFARSLCVDEHHYDVNSIQAELKDGLLKVSLKKIPQDIPEIKKIEVK
jgi:HSP20 family protein